MSRKFLWIHGLNLSHHLCSLFLWDIKIVVFFIVQRRKSTALGRHVGITSGNFPRSLCSFDKILADIDSFPIFNGILFVGSPGVRVIEAEVELLNVIMNFLFKLFL